ncbi:MAG: carboxylating nicotinate-nucleotide diphosphorylase [Thermoplasmatota archaeon]
MGRGTDLQWYLSEDVGRGDITTDLLLGAEDPEVRAVVTANEACVVAGLDEAEELFRSARAQVFRKVLDGEEISRGTQVMTLQGGAKGILSTERVALNFIMQMSGIATETRRLVRRCRRINPRVRIAATRKTTPGFRYYEKKAVAIGGGATHRFRLDDMVLIKDNHLRIFPSVSEAVRKAKGSGYSGKVEVEVTSVEMAREAAEAGADIVLLDNLGPEEAARAYRAVKGVRRETEVEVSGGINARNILRYARCADIISLGVLTHSARAADFSLTLLEVVEDREAKEARRLAREMVESLTEEMTREHSARRRQRI